MVIGVSHEAETKSFWDRRAPTWIHRAEVINEHLASYGRRGVEALALVGGERVLDVGCGAGYATLELAERVGDGGHVVGVDVAPAMIAAAERLVRATANNVSFMIADAACAEFAGFEEFDAAYARFSVALFDDPVAGLANIRRALRPGGRLVCLIWGPRQENPWMYVPRLAAAQILGIEPPELTSDHGLHSALLRLRDMLEGSGFDEIDVQVVTGARRISDATVTEDITTLFEEGGGLSDTWPALDKRTRRRCIDAVVAAMAPYRTPWGWSLPGCAVLGAAVSHDNS